MERHSENAEAVAGFLERHPLVARVAYPGLKSHPQHELAKRQLACFGGMITFELHGGYEAGVTLMNSLELISLAESLGAVESMITHPASMTHVCVPREERLSRGISDGLVRLSVGIESAVDIEADLTQALTLVESQKEESRISGRKEAVA
jgi:cystathionine beta-lyase/cystathionine gamma-synthase